MLPTIFFDLFDDGVLFIVRYEACNGYIRDYKRGVLKTQPGQTEEETLEVTLGSVS